MLKKCLPRLFTGCLLFAIAGNAGAQTNSGIRGTVLDKDGAPLPTAHVTVANTTLGVNQVVITDAKGEFRIVPLPAGKGYSLTVEFPQMAKVTQSDIELTAGKVTSLPITLRPSSEVTERVRVVGTGDVVNTESTTTSTTFSSEFIDSLPILGRQYQDILSLAPGVTDTDGDGNVNIHGSRDTDVVTLVDGVSTVDPYSGKVGQQLNIDSIQDIEVKTSGASAEFGRAQGGFVNIVTKSGGNEFEGNFKFYWRSNIFDGDGAGIDSPQLHGGLGDLGLRDLKFNDLNPFLSVGGPIRKDKAWYYFTAEYIQKEDPVNALTQAFVRATKEKRVFGKVSWDVSTNHKLVFTSTLDPQEYDNLGLDSFTNLDSGYTEKFGGLNLVLKETAIFSPNVFLETTVQHFASNPQRIPTTNPDTNGNGILFIDRNNNHFIDASERDPGEDYDRDVVPNIPEGRPDAGAPDPRWDVFEDFNDNGKLESNEDLDQDGRLTPAGGCEGATREDQDCDGVLDNKDERILGDIDHDNRIEDGTEDRNRNGFLDDRPRPSPDDPPNVFAQCEPGKFPCVPIGTNPYYYPYEHARPLSGDLNYQQDQRTLRISGPYNENIDRHLGRITLRQDLTVFVPDWFGQHDMKFGGIVEREKLHQDYVLRPYVFPNLQPPGATTIKPTVGIRLPAENEVLNEATSTTFGIYANDTYKPLPNLTVNLGVRFDREATDSFGYTHFDPRQERATFNKIFNLAGGEGGKDEALLGNNDGITSLGYCVDPIFRDIGGNVCQSNSSGSPIVSDLQVLRRVAQSRLTQHHTSTQLAASSLATLFQDLIDPVTGEIDRDKLRQTGYATFQEREPFRLTNNNLAPRISVSWDPWGDSKTKVFANWSRFFDKLFLETVVPEEGPDAIYRYYKTDRDGLTGAGVPDGGFGPVITKAPPSAFQVDRGLQTPFTDEMTVGFERELAPEVSLKITYINRKFRQQLQDRDINHSTRCCEGPPNDLRPLDQFGRLNEAAGQNGGGTPGSDYKPDLFVQNFFFNQIYRVGNFNHSRYKGIEVEVTKRLSRKWQLESSYTYSRARGNAEEFDSTLGDDPSTIKYEFGYLSYDIRHQVKFNAVTYLPGDWQLGSTISWSSGLPYSVVSNFFSLDNFNYPQYRTLFGGIQKLPQGKDANGQELDPEHRGFALIPERRNSRRNPSVYNINVEAHKAFVLGKMNSKLFLTVENLLNTDDITIFTYEPSSPDRGGALQLDSERRFGRRFEIGFQFEF
jgi:TonB dependent receptor/Carboxypeptidase regulatory-like domain/TonB-dependent Receptor Plug Domain